METTTASPAQVKAGPSAAASTHELFERLTGIDTYFLEEILVRQARVPDGASAKATRDRLAEFVQVNRAEAARMLGLSQSRLSRNDEVEPSMLDRVFDVARTYTEVTKVLGSEGAKRWFKQPNPGRGGSRPIDLLETRYGARRVANLIEALLGGAIV